ncbi:MAG TPA: hypothetical protein VFC55_01645, partial [Desulfobaccales bacterium]|nr:hypothetical protein [Desulfobaccales bacterium]
GGAGGSGDKRGLRKGFLVPRDPALGSKQGPSPQSGRTSPSRKGEVGKAVAPEVPILPARRRA